MICISQPPPTIVSRTKHKTGTYTGNGNNDRDIDIGVDLAAKSNVLVSVFMSDVTAQAEGGQRIEYGQGDITIGYAMTRITGGIKQLTSTGFRIGTHINVNQNGKNYCYVAHWEEP